MPMKHFTKLFVAIAMTMVAISVNAQEKVYANFNSPTNTNTTWTPDETGETIGTFTWNATYYNQLRNIGLPSGDISMYKKLVIDCTIFRGDKFRILFYQGGSNKTLWVTQSGVTEFNIKEELEKLGSDYNEYLLNCTEICLSGSNESADGEVEIHAVYLETYPENEEVDIPEIVEEEAPEKPEGYYDFQDEFPDLSPALGKKLGNGEVVIGQRSQQVVADLFEYSSMTIVTSPNLRLVLYMNHEIAAKQNPSEYTEDEAGQYVCEEFQADENGFIVIDLSQYNKQDLNCICLPWNNDNKGYVWYILLEKDYPIFNFNEMTEHPVSSNSSTDGDITVAEGYTKGKINMTISPAEEGANTQNRFWSTNDGPQLRMYSGFIVMDAPEGKAITKVEVDNARWNPDNTFNDEYTGQGLWEGNSTNVFLKIAGNTQINKITVTVGDADEDTMTFDNLPDSINAATVEAGKGEVFNLAGQKLAAPMKGLNIIGGKKVLVK